MARTRGELIRVKVLIVAAHADDETLGAGGAIVQHTQEGDDVFVLWLVGNRDSRGWLDRGRDLTERENAMASLGVKNYRALDFPDQKLDSIPILDLTKAIEWEITHYKPEAVYTHSVNDKNLDHRITYQATIPAVRPWRSSVKELRCFEIPPVNQDFNPDLYLDIDMDRKLAALRCYASELRQWPDPRSIQAVQIMAQARGTGLNGFAEAFESVRYL